MFESELNANVSASQNGLNGPIFVIMLEYLVPGI